jgi:hypothetical protein
MAKDGMLRYIFWFKENNERGDQGCETTIHCSGDCQECAIQQHLEGDDTCLLNCATHLFLIKL